MIEKECVKCGVLKIASFVKRLDYGKRGFVDVYSYGGGKSFYNGLCHECRIENQRKARGHSKREYSKKPIVVAAVWAEKVAEEKFKSLGFSVSRVDFYGPDLICKMGDLSWTVEVKRACYDARSWRTRRVHRKRKLDDLVAIVLPAGGVYIDSMESHLARCGKNGCRSVTDLLRFDRISAGAS